MPQRIAATLPRVSVAAGQTDPFNGDFVPAIELDVPMRIASLIADSNVIAPGLFTMVEKDLDAGTIAVIPKPELEFRSGYGYILHKNRALSPATQAFMQEFRHEEKVLSEREQSLERRYLSGTHRSS
jgi:DNA-binding transcriptional LysR family regulator